MKKIAIAEENKESIEYIQKMMKDVIYKQNLNMDIMTFRDAGTLLDEIEDGRVFDLYILDIEMPGMNGIELARRIKEKDNAAYIIFVISYSEVTTEGHDVHACHYLMQEVLSDKLPEVLNNICSEFVPDGVADDNGADDGVAADAAVDTAADDNSDYYKIQTKFRLEKIKAGDIIWVGKEGKNAVFTTVKGKIRQRTTLQEVESQLPAQDFILIERSRIVNLRYVERMIRNQVVLSNGETLIASRANMAKVKKELAKYWGRKL